MDKLIHISGTYPDLQIKDYGGWGSRNESTLFLLQEMFLKFEEHFLNKKLNFLIFTGDRPEEAVPYLRMGPVFAFSTTKKLRKKIIPIPDYIFIHSKEVGIEDWETMVKQCKDKADVPYEKEQCFWIGNTSTYPKRRRLVELSERFPDLMYALEMKWQPESGGKNIGNGIQASQYVSIPDHAKYKYLVDIQGIGWSSRLKLLMHLKRPVFIIKREYEEFFFPYMVPYSHFVPIKKNLSNLIPLIQWLNENNEYYQKIVAETEVFIKKYLNKEFALEYLFKTVVRHGMK